MKKLFALFSAAALTGCATTESLYDQAISQCLEWGYYGESLDTCVDSQVEVYSSSQDAAAAALLMGLAVGAAAASTPPPPPVPVQQPYRYMQCNPGYNGSYSCYSW